MLLYLCPHTTSMHMCIYMYVQLVTTKRRGRLAHRTEICISIHIHLPCTCCYVCVLILLLVCICVYMCVQLVTTKRAVGASHCPSAAICVIYLLYMCPHTSTICVCMCVQLVTTKRAVGASHCPRDTAYKDKALQVALPVQKHLRTSTKVLAY
jgi:hypothetical protein